MIYKYIRYLLTVPIFILMVGISPLVALIVAKGWESYIEELKFSYKMFKEDLL